MTTKSKAKATGPTKEKPSKSEAKAALQEQFAEADAAGNPAPADVAEATLSRAMRGY